MQNKVDLEDPTSLLDQVYLECTQRAAQGNHRIVMGKQKLFSKLISTHTDVNIDEKNPKTSQLGNATWKVTLKSVLNAVGN